MAAAAPDQRRPAEPAVTMKWLRAASLTTVLAVAAYLIVALWLERADLVAALKLISLQTLVIVLSLSLLNFGLRFLRWHWYLRMLGSSIRPLDNLRIYVGGFALTTTPGSAGELARTVWLRPYGVPSIWSIAALFAERILDAIAVALLACLGLLIYPRGQWLLTLSLLIATLLLILLFSPVAARSVSHWANAHQGRFAGLAARVAHVLRHVRDFLTPARAAQGLCLGLIAWSAEGWGFGILLHALGHPLPLTAAISIYALSKLAGATSLMPGGLGSSETTMIVLLKLLGIPLRTAVVATLLIRLATLWFAELLGFLALSTPARSPPEVAPVAPHLPTDSAV
jgi:glycosyltransferase 2 family protein